jgi:hypothetical protein
MSMVRAVLVAVLAIVLALTSVGAAMARGAMAGGSLVEICAEGGAATLRLDAGGNPVLPGAHQCLECLAALGAAPLPAPGPVPPLRIGVEARFLLPQDGALPGREAPGAVARGPPHAV